MAQVTELFIHNFLEEKYAILSYNKGKIISYPEAYNAEDTYKGNPAFSVSGIYGKIFLLKDSTYPRLNWFYEEP
jgi:hypothetical protein